MPIQRTRATLGRQLPLRRVSADESISPQGARTLRLLRSLMSERLLLYLAQRLARASPKTSPSFSTSLTLKQGCLDQTPNKQHECHQPQHGDTKPQQSRSEEQQV